VLVTGFTAGITGGLVTALGVATTTLALVLIGFSIAGIATGTVLLSRAAVATMFAPQQRPKAIALVLFGAVFGALLGPLVFGPLLQGDRAGSALELAWLGASGFMVAGLAVASRLMPVADAGAGRPQGTPPGRLRRAISAPGVPPAVFTVVASLAAMVGVMALVGTALVDHGHDHGAVFPVLSAHFIGMFGLFAVVGRAIERIGRPRAMVSGLLLIAVSATALLGAIDEIHWAALALFGIGLGWSFSLVAATAELSERAPAGESATLIGFSDLLGGLMGASLVAAGGFALDTIGLVAITTAATVLPVVAAVWIAAATRPAALATAKAAAE
jgi:MFS family permease